MKATLLAAALACLAVSLPTRAEAQIVLSVDNITVSAPGTYELGYFIENQGPATQPFNAFNINPDFEPFTGGTPDGTNVLPPGFSLVPNAPPGTVIPTIQLVGTPSASSEGNIVGNDGDGDIVGAANDFYLPGGNVYQSPAGIPLGDAGIAASSAGITPADDLLPGQKSKLFDIVFSVDASAMTSGATITAGFGVFPTLSDDVGFNFGPSAIIQGGIITIPEPTSLTLLSLIGLVGLAGFGRRSRRRAC